VQKFSHTYVYFFSVVRKKGKKMNVLKDWSLTTAVATVKSKSARY